ncbi:PEP-CTERM sorting domain-containing protein [Bythopirellula goksoeyrii]|uniref:PEP-CTERM protein-sorting domain-containing protein n=1 Tax=Bythopirellula goksoeyrii TaxID=1400387 RepID=A0A5B9Q4U0_9BACT|nr:PEP-CTERM sorting domain-containing protein [Bythopirellula goksoeyrii]QEG33987.1 hypothetical protein Pr1d_12580 [Bythopirellula goksoeyrii]
MQAYSKNWLFSKLVAVIAVGLLFASISSTTHAQLLYSFETGLDDWAATGFSNSDFISVATSTMGATEGLQSLAVETGPTFGWDVNVSVGPGDTNVYGAFNAVAADLQQYTLDFDVSITPDSFANVTSAGNFFTINVAANSDSPNFPQAFNVSPNLNGLTGTFPISIPMSSLPVAQNSSFYQLNIGSNSDHVNGGGGEGVKYFVDNIRFTALPQLEEITLFSWETPDDPGTPGVNEQLENWTNGFGQPGHIHSISTLGATDGSSSLQIDRQSHTTPNFTWGSQFVLSSDTNPDPEIEDIDPTIQGLIDEIVGKVNGGLSVAFDVRFDDPFPNSPTFTKFGVHFSDDQGTFYDAEGSSFNGSPPIGTTGTVTIPLSSMIDNTSGLSLEEAGLSVGTNFLRIGIASNTDGAGIYQIDNFRIIREISSESGDFDNDGDVDGNDFLVWQRGGSPNGINSGDLAIWQAQYGGAPPVVASSPVPEPTSFLLTFGAFAVFMSCRRRK